MFTDWLHLTLVLGLVLLYGAYLLAVGPLRRRYHSDYRIWAEPVEMREVLLMSGGVLALLVADASPLHDWSENYLLTAHMVQHLLMTMVAPPLILLGLPAWFFRPVQQTRAGRYILRRASNPIVAIVFFNVGLAAWHLPQFYNAALQSHYLHYVEHITFLLGAFVLWWPVLSPLKDMRLHYPGQILYLFVQSLLPAVVAAFITFSDRLIYTFYADKARLLDELTPVLDQQIAGLLMKLVGTFILWLVATIIFFIWYNHEEAEIEKLWEK